MFSIMLRRKVGQRKTHYIARRLSDVIGKEMRRWIGRKLLDEAIDDGYPVEYGIQFEKLAKDGADVKII